MKKFIALFLSVLVVGSMAFADAAAENYLSHFESLVTKIEADAKNKNASSISFYETQKKAIDAERATVTLSLLQRFTDWRYTSRYDSAHSKLEAYAKTDSASSKVDKVGDNVKKKTDEVVGNTKEKAGEVVNSTKEKADEVVGTVKDSAGGVVESAKTTVNEKAGEIKDAAKDKADEVSKTVNKKAEELENTAKEKAQDVKDAANDKVQKGTSKVSGFFNRIFGSGEDESD